VLSGFKNDEKRKTAMNAAERWWRFQQEARFAAREWLML